MKKEKGKICGIFNYAPHYRLPVYRQLAEVMDIDFFFGANLPGGEKIEKLDFSQLPGFRKEMTVHQAGPFRWTYGWVRLALSGKYGKFLITQDLYAINQWLFLAACRLLKKPVYVWTHGIRIRPPRKDGSATTRILRSWYDSFVKGYFLYSERARENMWLAGFNADKLHVVYNSLDYARTRMLREVVPDNPYIGHFSSGAPVIVFIGRLTRVKMLGDLVLLHDRLKDKGITTNVAFIGDGPEKATLQEMVREGDSGEFMFAGAEYDEGNIHKYLYHATICISPGNVGLTAITCLSHGLPVITHDDLDRQMPECESIVHGKTGDFYRYGDMDDLENITRIWLARMQSPKEREDIRKECYRTIDGKYNPEYQAEVFRKAIEGGTRSEGR